jgi:hypothetical protein
VAGLGFRQSQHRFLADEAVQVVSFSFCLVSSPEAVLAPISMLISWPVNHRSKHHELFIMKTPLTTTLPTKQAKAVFTCFLLALL